MKNFLLILFVFLSACGSTKPNPGPVPCDANPVKYFGNNSEVLVVWELGNRRYISAHSLGIFRDYVRILPPGCEEIDIDGPLLEK